MPNPAQPFCPTLLITKLDQINPIAHSPEKSQVLMPNVPCPSQTKPMPIKQRISSKEQTTNNKQQAFLLTNLSSFFPPLITKSVLKNEKKKKSKGNT